MGSSRLRISFSSLDWLWKMSVGLFCSEFDWGKIRDDQAEFFTRRGEIQYQHGDNDDGIGHVPVHESGAEDTGSTGRMHNHSGEENRRWSENQRLAWFNESFLPHPPQTRHFSLRPKLLDGEFRLPITAGSVLNLCFHIQNYGDFSHIISDDVSWFNCLTKQLRHPSALNMFEQIIEASKGKQIVMFLDYDGTLSPIVDDPDRAFMSDAVSSSKALFLFLPATPKLMRLRH